MTDKPKNSYAPADMFPTVTADGIPPAPLVLVIKGLGAVPSFKTGKRAFAWIEKAKLVTTWLNGFLWLRKDTIKVMARPITMDEHRQWMERAVLSIASQLNSSLKTVIEKTQTAACPRSLIASYVPLDDSWNHVPEIVVKCELCRPGEEGATILIERIS